METKINTRKEALLAQKIELQNQLAALKGQEPRVLETWEFRREAKDAREHGLKDDIERLTKAIDQQIIENDRKAQTEAYYATEEGQARKAELETRKDQLHLEFQTINTVVLDMLKSWIKDFLGDHWTVRRLNKGRVDFQIWDQEKDEFVFGSEIEIWADKHYYWNDDKERFETNIGAMGSFSLMDQDPSTRARFYMDLGKFLSDRERLNNLKNMMFLYEDRLEEIREATDKTSKELSNPLGL